jgi:hypothetical protein
MQAVVGVLEGFTTGAVRLIGKDHRLREPRVGECCQGVVAVVQAGRDLIIATPPERREVLDAATREEPLIEPWITPTSKIYFKVGPIYS